MGTPYAGVRDHSDAVFNTHVVRPEGGHPVPISNFMNAQCTLKLPNTPLLRDTQR